MSYNMKLSEFSEKLVRGDFDFGDTKTQIGAGWYDWFCRDTSLVRKTKVLGKKVTTLMKSKRIDSETMYVFFKNNCPVYGSLYDDFRFCDIKTQTVIYTVIPKNGHNSNKGVSEVWGAENNFEEPLVAGSWKDVKAFFGV